jgi:hypothetical protein
MISEDAFLTMLRLEIQVLFLFSFLNRISKLYLYLYSIVNADSHILLIM